MPDLKSELLKKISDEISPEAARLWLEDCTFAGLRNGCVELEFSSVFKRKMAESRFGKFVGNAVHELVGSDYPVRFTLQSDNAKKAGENEAVPGFESFVKGKNNELALACVLSATDRPSERLPYPVYIYGPRKTGKTHLLRAAEKRIRDLSPETEVMYIPAEELLELFSAPKKAFLLIDDYFSDEKGRMEAYLKSALETGTNIIAAGTLPPDEEEETGSFFLPRTDIVCTPADIQAPDAETLQAINAENALRMGRIPDSP